MKERDWMGRNTEWFTLANPDDAMHFRVGWDVSYSLEIPCECVAVDYELGRIQIRRYSRWERVKIWFRRRWRFWT